MSNVLITRTGLQYVLSAHDNGIYVDVRYFVPVYDDRFDATVRDASMTSAYTEVADESATAPVGEVIWNVSGYTLADNNDYLISASAPTGGIIQDTYQKSQVETNLYNSQPLSDQVSGTAYTVSGGSTTGLYDWTVTGAAGVSGSNNRPYTTTADFFPVKDYYPVYESSANNRLRGAFKADLTQSIGKFKFNKIALYAAQVDSNNVVTGYNFFGEAYIGNVPVVKTSLASDGFDNFIFDLQIDLSGTSATWGDVFFSSSADYWSHSPGGLYYPNKVGIGSFEDNSKAISATAHLRKPRDGNGDVDTTVPTLRLDYSNTQFMTIDADGNQHDVTVGSRGTDIELAVGDIATYCGDTVSIHPKVKATIALGTTAYPFRELHLANSSLDAGTKDMDSIVPLKVTNNHAAEAININSGRVKLGSSVGAGGTIADDPYGIAINDVGIKITGNTNQYGAFKGGDLWRSGQDLLIYNGYYTIGSTEYDVKNIYLMAGVDELASYTSVDSQTGATHKNILGAIDNDALLSASNTNLSNTAELHIAAKGELGLHGPITISNINENTEGDAIVTSKSPDNNVFLGAGIDTTFASLSNSMYNWVRDMDTLGYVSPGTDWFSGYANTSSRLFLVAGKEVVVDCNINPAYSKSYSLGDNVQFNTFYGSRLNIGVGATQMNDYSGDTFTVGVLTYSRDNYIGSMKIQEQLIGANPGNVLTRKTVVTPGVSNYGHDSNVAGHASFNGIHTLEFGESSNRITAGYFTSFNTTNLTATNVNWNGQTAGVWNNLALTSTIHSMGGGINSAVASGYVNWSGIENDQIQYAFMGQCVYIRICAQFSLLTISNEDNNYIQLNLNNTSLENILPADGVSTESFLENTPVIKFDGTDYEATDLVGRLGYVNILDNNVLQIKIVSDTNTWSSDANLYFCTFNVIMKI